MLERPLTTADAAARFGSELRALRHLVRYYLTCVQAGRVPLALTAERLGRDDEIGVRDPKRAR